MKLLKGLVIKTTGSWTTVKLDNNDIVECTIRGKFRIKGIRTTNPIAVGDRVFIEKVDESNGVIVKLEQRKNYIIRRSTNLSKETHIIASNIDHAFLMVTVAEPETSLMFIDRILISAEAYDIPVTLIFNKTDIYDDSQLEMMEIYRDIYESIGYKTVAISVKNRTNITEIENLMKDSISVFIGLSGVGKSSLVNAIEPTINIKTEEISETHLQGKHTTTFAEMHKLSIGGYIIDTPGIRSFGLVEMENKHELSHFFPEIFKVSKDCKFNNCTHTHEPGCAVKQAVEDNKIPFTRYENYLLIIQQDEDEKYRQDIYSE